MQLRTGLLLAVALVSAWLDDARADGGALEVRASSEVGAYSDTDHVAVVTPSISGHVGNPAAGWSVDGSYLVDVISAASVDIVSTASRRWTEVRQAGSVRGSYKPHDLGGSVEGSVSSEPDYLAFAAGGYVTKDLDDRNLSLAVGYGYGHDTIGRTGTPFSVYSHAFEHHALSGGLTRLIDRRTVLAMTADVTIESGDSSKPYRYIPLFSPEVAPTVQAGATVQEVSRLRSPETVLERLPLSRDRFGLTARLARRIVGATLRLESSLYDDSWGIKAFSADGRHLFDVGPRFSMGPHLRYYVQSPATFWKLAYITNGDSVPAYRTGDRELGPLINFTLGARARWDVGPASSPDEWIVVASFDTTYTRFLDDLYITERLSALGVLTLEGSW